MDLHNFFCGLGRIQGRRDESLGKFTQSYSGYQKKNPKFLDMRISGIHHILISSSGNSVYFENGFVA